MVDARGTLDPATIRDHSGLRGVGGRGRNERRAGEGRDGTFLRCVSFLRGRDGRERELGGLRGHRRPNDLLERDRDLGRTDRQLRSRRRRAAAAFWVGLGGYNANSQALEQAGTASDCDATSGEPSYYAWYELVPDPSVTTKL